MSYVWPGSERCTIGDVKAFTARSGIIDLQGLGPYVIKNLTTMMSGVEQGSLMFS